MVSTLCAAQKAQSSPPRLAPLPKHTSSSCRDYPVSPVMGKYILEHIPITRWRSTLKREGKAVSWRRPRRDACRQTKKHNITRKEKNYKRYLVYHAAAHPTCKRISHPTTTPPRQQQKKRRDAPKTMRHPSRGGSPCDSPTPYSCSVHSNARPLPSAPPPVPSARFP